MPSLSMGPQPVFNPLKEKMSIAAKNKLREEFDKDVELWEASKRLEDLIAANYTASGERLKARLKARLK